MNTVDKFDLDFFEENYRDGRCVVEMEGYSVEMFEEDDCYIVHKEPSDPLMVCEEKYFFADTLTLMSEGKCLKLGGVKIGVWNIYSPFGEIEETTDYEEGWTIGWEALVPFIIAKGIDLHHVVNINRYEEPYTDEEDGSESVFHLWTITALNNNGQITVYTFDGDDGSFLWSEKKTIIP